MYIASLAPQETPYQELKGPDVAYPEYIAAWRGERSVRIVTQLLQNWKSALTPKERIYGSSGTTALE